MTTILTLDRDGPDAHEARPTARTATSASAGETLASSLLLKAMSAGWLTPQDMSMVIPMLAFQHEVAINAVHHLVDNGLATDAIASGILGTLGRQRLQYDKVLRATEAVRLTGESLPGFAKHLEHQSLVLCEQANDSTADDICSALRLIQAHVLAELTRGLDKASAGSQPLGVHAAERFDAHGTWSSSTGPILGLHLDFLEELHAFMRFTRMRGMSDRIQARVSLERKAEPPIAMFPGVGQIMCEECDDMRGIEFTVERYPCTAEVLDPRVVRIPPGKSNNRHKHAHETLFYFIEGDGEILVGEEWVPVKPGDAVFSPRWAMHQTRNTGSTQLTLLAITDYYLTSQVYVGKYDKI